MTTPGSCAPTSSHLAYYYRIDQEFSSLLRNPTVAVLDYGVLKFWAIYTDVPLARATRDSVCNPINVPSVKVTPRHDCSIRVITSELVDMFKRFVKLFQLFGGALRGSPIERSNKQWIIRFRPVVSIIQVPPETYSVPPCCIIQVPPETQFVNAVSIIQVPPETQFVNVVIIIQVPPETQFVTAVSIIQIPQETQFVTAVSIIQVPPETQIVIDVSIIQAPPETQFCHCMLSVSYMYHQRHSLSLLSVSYRYHQRHSLSLLSVS